ncbi:hypothetical protein D0X99_07010 [Algoriphagus lacus]|uniref:Uncharacterized protein n=1 Tax=Algoriphagus lacus TaxID=2056311 RepID=A0A418PV89_9BACT|nr:hypothetical protein D0X99_07010 [Algoriphagus lacus]
MNKLNVLFLLLLITLSAGKVTQAPLAGKETTKHFSSKVELSPADHEMHLGGRESSTSICVNWGFKLNEAGSFLLFIRHSLLFITGDFSKYISPSSSWISTSPELHIFIRVLRI